MLNNKNIFTGIVVSQKDGRCKIKLKNGEIKEARYSDKHFGGKMTNQQLQNLEQLLKKQHPGWSVARGGILMSPAKGLESVACNTPIGIKVIVVNFDTMAIEGMQG